MKGDALASGGKRATFGGPSGVTQERWDAIFGPPEKKPVDKSKASDHPLKKKLRFAGSKDA